MTHVGRTSTLGAKLEAIPFGQKPGDSSAWKAKFDSLVADLKSIGTALQLNRIWSLYSSSQTYEEIVAILQREYDYLNASAEAKAQRERTADINELRQF